MAEEYHTLALVGKAGLGAFPALPSFSTRTDFFLPTASGTLHMDGNTRLCTATAAAAMRESFGCDGQPGSYTDFDHCDTLFLVRVVRLSSFSFFTDYTRSTGWSQHGGDADRSLESRPRPSCRS
jgi:anaerobic selenocysteine-containing dehydrogenase